MHLYDIHLAGAEKTICSCITLDQCSSLIMFLLQWPHSHTVSKRICE